MGHRLTARFNVAAFSLLAIVGIVKFLLTSDKVNGSSPIGVFLSIGFDATYVLALILAVSLLIRIFWNRFVTDVFSLRDIDYQEAVAIVMVASLLGT
jgi:hypothetical protein